MEKYDGENRRKRFFPTLSLGSLVATLTFAAAGVGVYASLYADVSGSKVEIANIKANELKKEQSDRDARREIRDEVREVKGDVKELNQKVDRVLLELSKIPKPPARGI